ncbi:MAG: sugar phosphate nucleotidyltransferase [Alphaproteobacteria bacterium]
MFKSEPKISQAIILAAGFGTRMQPLTFKTPKPLVKINNKPILYYILEELKKNNIKNCFINTHHLSEKIEKYINEYKYKNQTMNINIVNETKILDTGGAIKNIKNKDTSKPILVINGDSIIIPNHSENFLSQLISNFKPRNMDFLLLLDNKKTSIGYDGKGDFSFYNINMPSQIYRNNSDSYAFTGWQILNPKIIDKVRINKFSLNICYDKAIKNNSIWGMINSGKWLHIGTKNALNRSNDWFKETKK